MDPSSFTIAAVTDDLAAEPDARDHADMLEFRLDLATDPLAAIETYTGVLPIIATNRVTSEGGAAPDTPERLDTLEQAVTADAVHAIDIELDTLTTDRGEEIATTARQSKVTVIASSHDFDTTPPADSLREQFITAANAGDIGKVAVTATTQQDTLTLLTLTHDLAESGYNIAALSMGDIGRHTRVIAPLYGSRITYAPIDQTEATAPGQYDLETLVTLLTSLR